ncbi:hypothetical protein G7Z17_g10359 [Cylindrodendrum hubeiense]|uniref:Uncharacterized protein n=1 Tax=Cylindrodendrum hubeiense TaxID=595255 RepID=A0A9P5L4V6_9HYPO|nr:hypothetical protein G7Z17_g10359 [Cylindrodendrum hubeiense]
MGTGVVDAAAARRSRLRLARQAMFELERDGIHSQETKQTADPDPRWQVLFPRSRIRSANSGVCPRAGGLEGWRAGGLEGGWVQYRTALHCTVLYRTVLYCADSPRKERSEILGGGRPMTDELSGGRRVGDGFTSRVALMSRVAVGWFAKTGKGAKSGQGRKGRQDRAPSQRPPQFPSTVNGRIPTVSRRCAPGPNCTVSTAHLPPCLAASHLVSHLPSTWPPPGRHLAATWAAAEGSRHVKVQASALAQLLELVIHGQAY